MAGIFADIKTPFIDKLTVKRLLSPEVKKNIFQEIIVKPEQAVTEKFSEDTDAAEIQVLRQKVLANDARELGADTNGDWWNTEAPQTSATEAYGIQILQTMDRCINIKTNAQDMVSVDLLAGETENLAGLVARNVNAMSIAAMIAKNFNNIAGFDKKNSNAATVELNGDKPNSNWIAKATNWTDAIIDAGTKLDEGNEQQDIDAYPDNQRAVFIRADIKGEIVKNMTGLYGGTDIFKILKNGGVDTETTPVITRGFVGEINNMPVYVLSNTAWKLVEAYLGLAPKSLDKLKGIACSGMGTGRALAFNHAIKVVDAQGGQGLQLQPCYRFGAECWDPLSVVPMFDTEFVNPVTMAGNVLFLRGKGSRA